MHPNPNKFLTFLFSLLPGAGHMYLGLMKRGLSFMVLFGAAITAAFMFNHFFVQPFALMFGLCVPVVWFITFFDLWRYPRMDAEQKAAQHDEFLLMQGTTVAWKPIARKFCVLGGVLMIVAAVMHLMQFYLPRISRWFEWWNLRPLIGAGFMLALGIATIVIFTRKPKQQPASENEVIIESETEN